MCDVAQVSDRALIDRVLTGDTQAADAFVTRFSRLVWWILIHQIRLSTEPAEEVYQNVFVHLWEDDYRRLRLWTGDGDFAAYLAPIVRHRAMDRIRQTESHRLPETDEPRVDPVDEHAGPDELARVEERRRMLERAVVTLGDTDRELYELRFVEERSYKEIADVLGITVNNVGVRVSRMIERLRAAIVGVDRPKNLPDDVAVRLPGQGPSPG
jgi:RNA polymerase sigma-70 factor (ECF subfamily)